MLKIFILISLVFAAFVLSNTADQHGEVIRYEVVEIPQVVGLPIVELPPMASRELFHENVIDVTLDQESLDLLDDNPIDVTLDQESLDLLDDNPIDVTLVQESLDLLDENPIDVTLVQESLDLFDLLDDNPIDVTLDQESLDLLDDNPIDLTLDQESLDLFDENPIDLTFDQESLELVDDNRIDVTLHELVEMPQIVDIPIVELPPSTADVIKPGQTKGADRPLFGGLIGGFGCGINRDCLSCQKLEHKGCYWSTQNGCFELPRGVKKVSQCSGVVQIGEIKAPCGNYPTCKLCTMQSGCVFYRGECTYSSGPSCRRDIFNCANAPEDCPAEIPQSSLHHVPYQLEQLLSDPYSYPLSNLDKFYPFYSELRLVPQSPAPSPQTPQYLRNSPYYLKREPFMVSVPQMEPFVIPAPQREIFGQPPSQRVVFGQPPPQYLIPSTRSGYLPRSSLSSSNSIQGLPYAQGGQV